MKKSSPLGCVRPLMFFSQLSANLNILLDLWYPVTEFFRKECESKESADPVADKVAALYSEKRFHLLSIFGLLLVMEVLTWTERRFRPSRDFSRCATHTREH